MKKIFCLLLISVLINAACKKNKTNAPVPDINVTTLAGSGTQGAANGKGIAASFNFPVDVVVDAAENVFVADLENNSIRKITPGGVVTTFAGSGISGHADGVGLSASFSQPNGLAIDAGGNIYVTDEGNALIRKITPVGEVTTIAGMAGVEGNNDGPAHSATFHSPTNLVVDASGNIFVTEILNRLIRKISAAGIVTTFAGNGEYNSKDGKGTEASFKTVYGIAIDGSGNLYVSDDVLIRKITADGVVTHFAGNGFQGGVNGTLETASFAGPVDLAFHGNSLYIADGANNLIRKITPDGIVSTVAGSGAWGADNGAGNIASFKEEAGLAIAANGNIYVADTKNHMVRKITIRQ